MPRDAAVVQRLVGQWSGEGKALRTETTINNTYDFGVRKGLTNLPALREALVTL
jgi:hypothetical protein